MEDFLRRDGGRLNSELFPLPYRFCIGSGGGGGGGGEFLGAENPLQSYIFHHLTKYTVSISDLIFIVCLQSHILLHKLL